MKRKPSGSLWQYFLVGVALFISGLIVVGVTVAVDDQGEAYYRGPHDLVLAAVIVAMTGATFSIVTLAVGIVLFVHEKLTRVEPGHCSCGYNLTGNESGTCPECGVEVRA